MSEIILQQILEHVKQINERLGNLENEVAITNKRLDNLEKEVTVTNKRLDSLDSRVDNIEIRLTSLESGQKELNEIVRAIHDRQEETDAKLEALTMDVHRLRADVKRIEQQLEQDQMQTNANLDKLSTIINFTLEKTNKNELAIYDLQNT